MHFNCTEKVYSHLYRKHEDKAEHVVFVQRYETTRKYSLHENLTIFYRLFSRVQ